MLRLVAGFLERQAAHHASMREDERTSRLLSGVADEIERIIALDDAELAQAIGNQAQRADDE